MAVIFDMPWVFFLFKNDFPCYFPILWFYFALSLYLCIFPSILEYYISPGSVFHNSKLLLSYAFIAFSALLIFPSYLQLISILFHTSDTSPSLSPLVLLLLALHLQHFSPDAFFTCIFLVVFPTVKFVFITRVFLQRLAGLICCVFISFLLSLPLCLYFHFHFWDVGQDNRVGRAAGTGHKPIDVVQLFVVTISLRLRLCRCLCRCRPLARLASWFLALAIFSSSDLFCLPFSPSSARLGSTQLGPCWPMRYVILAVWHL